MANILLYVDPGSSSYLVQMISAAVIGAVFYFKTIWWRIKSIFWKNKTNKEPEKDQIND